MTTVMVTGASGFIGRHAVSSLHSNGFTVHAVARRPPNDLPGVWHSADLLDRHARRELIDRVRPTHLLHLAWETRHRYFWTAPENLDWVAASLDLVRQFRELGGERAVFAGTCAEYDWGLEALKDGICREDTTPCRPQTLYGVAKHATHSVVATYARDSGLSYAWARLFFVFGPHESENRLVPSIARALLTRHPIDLGGADKVRDFLHTEDAGRAFASILESNFEGSVNVGSGQGTSFARLAETMAGILGADARLLRFGARAPGPEDPTNLLADTSRLRRLGFTTVHTLKSGLSDALEWWSQRVGPSNQEQEQRSG